MDADGAVFGFVGVFEDADDGFADGGEGGGAVEAVAAVVEGDGFRLGAHGEVQVHAPVEEGTGVDEGVG